MVLIVPMVTLAQSGVRDDKTGLVPCGNEGQEPCDFNSFLLLIHNGIKFLLFDLAVPIAAIMFAYAGVLLVTTGSSEGKTKAKNIFTNTVIGLAVAAGAWLIINTILGILGFDGSWIGFGK